MLSKYYSFIRRVFRSNLSWYVPKVYAPVQPHFAALMLTDACCFKCIMCGQWKRPIQDELTLKEWKSIFDQLKQLGIRNISLAGGEPLMRKDLFELLAYAQSLGFTIGIMTNGYLIDRAMMDKLISYGVSSISVSIDAVGDEFDKIRGMPGAYKRVVDALEYLAQLRAQKKMDVQIYFTLMNLTLRSYKQVFSLSEEYRVPFIVNLLDDTPYFFEGIKVQSKKLWIGKEDLPLLREFQEFLIAKKRESPDLVFHTYEEINFFKEYFADPIQADKPCIVSQIRLGIDPCGAVFGGCWSMGSFGNVRTQPLKEIIASPAYKEAHRNMFYKKCPGCSCGYTTSLRYFIPSRMREILYKVIPSLRQKIYE